MGDNRELIAEARKALEWGPFAETYQGQLTARVADALEAALVEKQVAESSARLSRQRADEAWDVIKGDYWRNHYDELAKERDALTQKLSEAQAVIAAIVDASQRVEGGVIPWVEIEADDWDAILSQSPADVLQAVKAAAWDEGVYATPYRGSGTDAKVLALNPYRKGQGDE